MSPNLITRKPSERGATVVLFTFLLGTIILPGVGLAIDGTMAFVAKAKLSAAADAAALAGARALSVGPDQPSQAQSANLAAIAYFNANFTMAPTNINAANPSPVTVTRSGSVRTVTVTVTSQVPVYFMRVLNFQTVSVQAVSAASRRDVNLMLVLDRTFSMSIYASGVCPTMIASAQTFVDKFASGSDRLGLVTFMGSAYQDFPTTGGGLSSNFQPVLKNIIGNMTCNGVTGTAEALSLAYNQFLNPDGTLHDTQALNVIVLYTDGQPDAITGQFVVNSPCISQPTPSNVLTGIIAAAGPTESIPFPPVGILEDIGIQSSSPGPLWGFGNQPLQSSEAQGCYFQQNSPNNINQMPSDVTAIPSQDVWGNSTAGAGYTPTNPWSSNDIQVAATNAATNAANTIRQKNILIYAIGESSSVNTSFLEQVANVPQSPTPYNSSQPVGYYVHAPTGSQLASAFNTIALQILRLSR